MPDHTKYKSISVTHEAYDLIQKIADREHRSVPMQLIWLIDKEAERLSIKVSSKERRKESA